jgi:hypothetical protein
VGGASIAGEVLVVVRARSFLGIFVARPWSSAALAVICAVIAVVAVTDLVPLSPNRRYFGGHQWVLASLYGLLAALFGYCAVKGLRVRARSSRQ